MKIKEFVVKQWKKLLGLAVALLIPTAYAGSQGNLPGQTKIEGEIITPTRQTITKTLSLSGQIDATEKVTLRFQSSGLLSWVGVKEGQEVKKGQLLSYLDQRSVQKQLKKEMNDYLAERNDFEDTQDQYKQTKENYLLTDQIKRILQKAQFDLESSVIDYELQTISAEYSRLTSPINGVVTKVGTGFSGINVTPTTAEIEVINPKTLYFSAEVDETDLKDLRLGQTVKVNLDAYPDKTFDGQVSYISFAPLTGVSGTVYEVSVVIPSEDFSTLRISLNGDAQVLLNEKQDALTLPTESIVSQEDQEAKINVLENGVSVEKAIQTGIQNDDFIEVLSGIDANTQVLIPKNETKDK